MTGSPLSALEFGELEAILDDLRAQHALTPPWEFCEGFMAALICCRRQIAPADYLPLVLTREMADRQVEALFSNAVQYQRFMVLWTRRWDVVRQALDTRIVALDDAAAYQPEVADAPSFGKRWAQGFMAVVKAWPQEWVGSRNKQAILWSTTALGVVEALTADDTDPPSLHAFEGDTSGPPTVSARRMQAFGDAIWAVYNMRETWRTLGPRVETVRAATKPGRNDPCVCGSGKKAKKCCG